MKRLAGRVLALALLMVFPLWTESKTIQEPSGLNNREFNRYWRIESESPDYRVTFRGDTCELTAPKGLTLWRREKLKADCAVEYDVQVVVESPPLSAEGERGPNRLSDMNCFWLASDPGAKDLWARANWRSGIFTRCYTLQMYYLGYGGNHNTTTRFRRYTGDALGVDSVSHRPAILTEYTDSTHLLRPNHWYHIKLQTAGGRTQMWVDGKLIVNYLDPEPLSEGWFGFRTTLSHTRITNFRSYAVATDDGHPTALDRGRHRLALRHGARLWCPLRSWRTEGRRPPGTDERHANRCLGERPLA